MKYLKLISNFLIIGLILSSFLNPFTLGLNIIDTCNFSVKKEILQLTQSNDGDIRFFKEIPIELDSHTWNTAAWDQSKLITYKNYQYVAFWNSDPKLVLARRDLNTDDIQIIEFPDICHDLDDPHRSTPIGISPDDGRLHIAYDHHNNPINYRVSDNGFITNPPTTISINHFSDNKKIVAETMVTYPRFYNNPDDDLYLMFRNGSASKGDTYIYTYHSDNTSWSKLGMLFSREGIYKNTSLRNAYENDIVFDNNGRMHVTWTWREDRGHEKNHDICYAYSDDYGVTWKNNEGEEIANLNEGIPIQINSSNITVVSVPLGSMLMNTASMDVDSKHQPHVFIFVKIPARRIHYWRTTDGVWHQQYIEKDLIVSTNNRPRGDVFIGEYDTLYHIFLDNKTLWYAKAEKTDNWKYWTITGFDVLNNNRENPKYDRFRLENDLILSIPIEEKNNSKYTFSIRDYYLIDGNHQPDIPDTPDGDMDLYVDERGTFSSASNDADGDLLEYLFDWGDESTSGWIGPYESGDIVSTSHSWDEDKEYLVRVKCRDNWNEESAWSEPLNVYVSGQELNVDCGGPYYGNIDIDCCLDDAVVSGGKQPYSYYWDFGDGLTSNQEKPCHMYKSAGEYSIVLKVTDEEGDGGFDSTKVVIYAKNNNSDLYCTGELSWSKVNGGSEVSGTFLVSNVGDNGSLLNWQIRSFPDWGGNWTFYPENGTNLSVDKVITVNVTVISPTINSFFRFFAQRIRKDFTGKIFVENIDNPEDYSSIPVSMTVPFIKESYLRLKFWNFLYEHFIQKDYCV